MSEKKECDVKGCNGSNVQSLTKNLNVCESHWFLIMNGIMFDNRDVIVHELQKLEEERINTK